MKTDISSLLKIGFFIGLGFSIPFGVMQYFTAVLMYDNVLDQVNDIGDIHISDSKIEEIKDIEYPVSLSVSDMVQRAAIARQVQNELKRKIELYDEVLNARVLIVTRNDPLDFMAKASVFVDLGDNTISLDKVAKIQTLVSDSIDSLEFKDVAVVDNKGYNLSAGVFQGGKGKAN